LHKIIIKRNPKRVYAVAYEVLYHPSKFQLHTKNLFEAK